MADSNSSGKVKQVYFGAGDIDLYRFTADLNFSEWVKNQIRREIKTRETGIDPEILAAVEKLINKKMAGLAFDKSGQDGGYIQSDSILEKISAFF
jgi:hypothetical protein